MSVYSRWLTPLSFVWLFKSTRLSFIHRSLSFSPFRRSSRRYPAFARNFTGPSPLPGRRQTMQPRNKTSVGEPADPHRKPPYCSLTRKRGTRRLFLTFQTEKVRLLPHHPEHPGWHLSTSGTSHSTRALPSVDSALWPMRAR